MMNGMEVNTRRNSQIPTIQGRIRKGGITKEKNHSPNEKEKKDTKKPRNNQPRKFDLDHAQS